jgi:hypothetical protein
MRKTLFVVLSGVCFFGLSSAAAVEDTSAVLVQAASSVPDTAVESARLPLFVSEQPGGQCAAVPTFGVEAPQPRAACGGCDSSQGSCTHGDGTCTNYCLERVGEIGFCSLACNCCMCPNIPPPPIEVCCRCDGGSDPSGLCGFGCRVVACS